MKIQNAFRIGLVGTLGVGVGLLILISIASLSTIITYIGAALFLALGLDPAISWLERRGLPRWAAILIVMTGVGLLVAALVLAVVPIIVDQVSQLVEEIPRIVERVELAGLARDARRSSSRRCRSHEISRADHDRAHRLLHESRQAQRTRGRRAAGRDRDRHRASSRSIIVLILTIYFAASLNA